MLQPKKLKHRKIQIRRMLKDSLALKGTKLVYGDVGLKALETKLISSKEIESVINKLKRGLGKKGRYWLRIFPHFPKTKKPPETRMGGGKGDIEDYVTPVKQGMILFEVDGLSKESLKEVLKQCAYKLSVRTKIVTR